MNKQANNNPDLYKAVVTLICVVLGILNLVGQIPVIGIPLAIFIIWKVLV